MALGLGIMYAVGAVGFAIIFATSKGFVWKALGRYGFLFSLMLSVWQENLTSIAGAPMSLGLMLFMLIAFLVFSLVLDSLFIIMEVLPMRRKNKPWNEILFGGE